MGWMLVSEDLLQANQISYIVIIILVIKKILNNSNIKIIIKFK